jgi:hypothetical protein
VLFKIFPVCMRSKPITVQEPSNGPTPWSRKILPPCRNIPCNDGNSAFPPRNEVLRATKQIFYSVSSSSFLFLRFIHPPRAASRHSSSSHKEERRWDLETWEQFCLSGLYRCHDEMLRCTCFAPVCHLLYFCAALECHTYDLINSMKRWKHVIQ